jgi:hypothetical protein
LLSGRIYEVAMNSSNKSGLAKFWDALKSFQSKIAVALSVVVLFVLYLTVFAVVAIIAKLLGQDLLRSGQSEPVTYWLKREPVEHALEAFARQF